MIGVDIVIYVIRHGQSVVNVERTLRCKKLAGDLTKRGRKQATKAGVWLKDKSIDRILASAFHRAEQTATIIADHLDLKVTIDARLGEMDCGDFEGKSDKESWKQWSKIYNRWKQGDFGARYHGGESYREGYDRLSACLREINPDENMVLVSHGGITRTVIPYLCVNAAALQRVEHLSNTGMILLEPYGDGRFICEGWDLKEHLE